MLVLEGNKQDMGGGGCTSMKFATNTQKLLRHLKNIYEENQMEAYQQRVIDERTELDERLKKLVTFLHSSIYQSLDEEEQVRLQDQRDIMIAYKQILTNRIKAFK